MNYYNLCGAKSKEQSPLFPDKYSLTKRDIYMNEAVNLDERINLPIVKAILHVLVVPGLVVPAMVPVRVVRMVRRERHPGAVARYGTARVRPPWRTGMVRIHHRCCASGGGARSVPRARVFFICWKILSHCTLLFFCSTLIIAQGFLLYFLPSCTGETTVWGNQTHFPSRIVFAFLFRCMGGELLAKRKNVSWNVRITPPEALLMRPLRLLHHFRWRCRLLPICLQ